MYSAFLMSLEVDLQTQFYALEYLGDSDCQLCSLSACVHHQPANTLSKSPDSVKHDAALAR